MNVLTNDIFYDGISTGVTLVKFGAIWCGPCRMVDKVLENVEKRLNDNESIHIFKIDVDESPNIAQEYGITSVPTLIYFKDGEIKNTFTGIQPEKAIVDTLNTIKDSE